MYVSEAFSIKVVSLILTVFVAIVPSLHIDSLLLMKTAEEL